MPVSSALVVKVVVRLFDPEDVERVLKVLHLCSAEVPDAERDRVSLAILKLYDEDPTGDLDKLSIAARADYRDVLLWAECPGEALAGARARVSSEELKNQRAADRRQYEAWLKGVA